MDDYKKRIEAAVAGFLQKQKQKEDKKAQGPSRKNDKPEKKVQQDVLAWCASSGWRISVVESKAVYSITRQRFLRGQARKGFADLVGLTDKGIFVAIELKAPGRRSTLRPDQRTYLQEVIGSGGFAAVVDSAKLLDSIFAQWQSHPDPRLFLRSCLPPEPKRRASWPLFD